MHKIKLNAGKQLAAMHGETLPKEAHKAAHFCTMEIALQVRGYAAKFNETPAARAGMAGMSERFRDVGDRLYVDANADNQRARSPCARTGTLSSR